MRTGVTVYLSPTDRKRLQAIVDDRNSPVLSENSIRPGFAL